jgi:tRNA 2-thiouridine synthesizing protein E
MIKNNDKENNVEEKLDCEGFLNDIEFWSVDLAEKLAKDNEIAAYGLTEAHWGVINYVRDYYDKYDRGPEVVKVAKNCGLSINDLCNLFPCGLVKGAYKLAGLPKPPGCI